MPASQCVISLSTVSCIVAASNPNSGSWTRARSVNAVFGVGDFVLSWRWRKGCERMSREISATCLLFTPSSCPLSKAVPAATSIGKGAAEWSGEARTSRTVPTQLAVGLYLSKQCAECSSYASVSSPLGKRQGSTLGKHSSSLNTENRIRNASRCNSGVSAATSSKWSLKYLTMSNTEVFRGGAGSYPVGRGAQRAGVTEGLLYLFGASAEAVWVSGCVAIGLEAARGERKLVRGARTEAVCRARPGADASVGSVGAERTADWVDGW